MIVSLTTSTAEEAPRGMDFLYSANRLNVATSRAKALCILVGNPKLFEPDCRTPAQMRLANAFCRYLELARVVAPPTPPRVKASRFAGCRRRMATVECIALAPLRRIASLVTVVTDPPLGAQAEWRSRPWRDLG